METFIESTRESLIIQTLMNHLNMKTSLGFYYYNMRKHKQCNMFAIVSYNKIIYNDAKCFVRYCFTRTHTHTHAHTHARMCTRTHGRTHPHARTHTHAHVHIYARTHIHTHIHTYTHTHIHTHTHPYTHILTTMHRIIFFNTMNS